MFLIECLVKCLVHNDTISVYEDSCMDCHIKYDKCTGDCKWGVGLGGRTHCINKKSSLSYSNIFLNGKNTDLFLIFVTCWHF